MENGKSGATSRFRFCSEGGVTVAIGDIWAGGGSLVVRNGWVLRRSNSKWAFKFGRWCRARLFVLEVIRKAWKSIKGWGQRPIYGIYPMTAQYWQSLSGLAGKIPSCAGKDRVCLSKKWSLSSCVLCVEKYLCCVIKHPRARNVPWFSSPTWNLFWRFSSSRVIAWVVPEYM